MVCHGAERLPAVDRTLAPLAHARPRALAMAGRSISTAFGNREVNGGVPITRPRSASATAKPFLRAGVIDEFGGRRLAPLRGERLLRRHQVGAVRQVEAVAVGPMLVHPAPGIGPVVVDLAAQHVPADRTCRSSPSSRGP